MEYQKVISKIKDVIDDLCKSGVIGHNVTLSDDTVLIGKGAELDSLSFVALIADLEDRMSSELKTDVAISLDELDNFNVESPFVSVRMLATYVAKIVA